MIGDLRQQLQQTLGDSYQLGDELGGGGMSRVFVATETALNRRVVIKVLPAETAAQVSFERFRREIQLAAQLQQAHIVPLLSAGEAAGLPYYTMPLVEGESLRARLSRERELPIGETIGILREMARALAYAHQRGVVHRDIKPDNVLLSGGSAMVTDFGVAKALSASVDAAADSTLTSLGMAVGTPAYMSPEQATADPVVDHRADIYAFGATAYELLTGQPPFTGRTPQAMLAAQVSETPEPVERRRPSVPPALAQLVMRCLAKRPADRPQSATEILGALDAMVATGTASPVNAGIRAVERPHRRWIGIAAALALVGVALTALVVWRPRTGDTGTSQTIAVLPLKNISGGNDDQPFREGMTIEITNALGKLPGLSVTAPGLARTVRSDSIDPRTAGQLLDVGSVLDGSYQHAGDSVRVSVQLVRVSNGVQEWSESYTFGFEGAFAIQDSIARAIVQALQLKLAGRSGQPLVRPATTSPEAHALYLQGLYEWNSRTTGNLQKAIGLFEQALVKDENYVQARAGLAMAYAVMPTFGDVPNEAMWTHTADIARRALAIDSTSAEAHSALGFAMMGMYRYATAEREFRTAIRHDSTFATAHQWLGQVLATTGRFDEGIAECVRARQLDPESRVIRTTLALLLFRARKMDSALTVLKELQAVYPTYPNTYRSFTQIYHAQRRHREALESAEQSLKLVQERLSYPLGQLGMAYAANGDSAKARAILQELVERSSRAPVNSIVVALLQDELGDREEAIRWLGRAVAQHDPWYNLARTPLFDRLRTDPRAAALLAKVESPGDPPER